MGIRHFIQRETRHSSLASLPRQGTRFAIVGLLTTATHVVIAIILIELVEWHPVPGNLVGFLASFVVAYLSNALWTFRAYSELNWRSFSKYAGLAVFGLFYNASIMALVVNVLQQPYFWGLAAIILSWPLISFLGIRHWVFGSQKKPVYDS